MRILAMVSRDPLNPALGGGETVMAEFAKALARRGHDVAMLCASFPGAASDAEVEGVLVHRLAPEAVLGAAAFLEYRRRYRGRVDLVLEDFLGGSRIPFFASLYVREPLVSLWFQDHLPIFREEFSPLLFPVLAGLERALVWTHRGSYLLACSERSRRDLIGKGADPARVRAYLPGIPEATLHAPAPPPASGREPRIVALGKIRRYKSQHQGILVLKALASAVPRATLVVAGRVGDPGYLEEMRTLARRLGLEDRVSFELRVSEDRKRELLRTSRAFLAPAPIEGFGIAIVEASACGLPAVGTTGVPEDALREGVNGFRVPYGDADAMARWVGRLLTDDAFFDGLSASAREFAGPFTWDRACQPLLELVEALGPRSPGPRA